MDIKTKFDYLDKVKEIDSERTDIIREIKIIDEEIWYVLDSGRPIKEQFLEKFNRYTEDEARSCILLLVKKYLKKDNNYRYRVTIDKDSILGQFKLLLKDRDRNDEIISVRIFNYII